MKKPILIIILAIVLCAGFYGYKNQQKNQITKNQDREEVQTEKAEENGSEEMPANKISVSRAINFTAHNITEISYPENAVLGGKWFVTRIWIVEESINQENGIQLYAEYEDGHIMRKVLTTIIEEGGETGYRKEAIFESGEADWKPIQGEDAAFGKSLLLYEKNEKTEEWEKK